jgi:hypothetical protein
MQFHSNSILLALEGFRQASLFEELNAATPSWTSARFPGSNLTPSEGGRKVLSAMSAKTKDVLSSLVEKSENSSLPPSLIRNLVNCDLFCIVILHLNGLASYFTKFMRQLLKDF